VYYYQIALLGSPLEPLIYSSKTELEIGIKVEINLRNRTTFGVVVKSVKKPEFKTNKILNITNFYFDKTQIQLANFISNYYVSSLGDALSLMVPFNLEVKAEQIEFEISKNIDLSNEQSDALEFLKKNQISLLFGDTGSGKTEIYMKYFQEIISQNKQVLFLMPEISLTPQMNERLKKIFKDSVVMWHSKLTPLQRKKALEKIYSNKAKVLAGPRSALFLPINNLGLIVVDEEHDNSYKSSSRPRYNARDLAIYLAKLHNINIVLGSATPSLSSYVKFPSIRLKGGFINSNKEFIYEKTQEDISELIINSLKQTIQKDEQAIIFLPTRANFKYLICKDCGASVLCEYCSIAMSIHHNSNALKCHYCNAVKPIPNSCAKCSSPNLISSRIGTAQAIKTIKEKLSFARIEQFDKDTITTNAKLKKILNKFNNKEIDILVGTQMLSKGHDYKDVTLAVILGMDNILNMGDYKAREYALSLLIQIAGRSGRAKDATVLVQTFNEEFFKAYIDDYQKFLDDEKVFRVGLYPPYKKLCRVLFAHKNQQKAQEEMQIMLKKLQEFKNIEIVGFGECLIQKVANKYRFEILIRSNKATDIIKAVKTSKTSLAQIDMDPLDFS